MSDLRGQLVLLGGDRAVFTRDPGDGTLVELRQLRKFESVEFPLARLDIGKRGSRDPKMLCYFLLAQADVFASNPESLTECSPVVFG